MKRSIELVSAWTMPYVGLGTFKTRGYDLLYTTLDAALAAGYRSFDTASVYRNETDIGKALKELLPKYNLTRKDIFITSKLGPADQGDGKASSAFSRSLSNLDCEYLDLYLIHWPGTHKLQPGDEQHKKFRRESWKAVEEAHRQGKLRSLGVSNYLQHHLEELLEYCTVKPSVLQIEYHPHLVQKSLKKFCDDHSIHLQAYSSLGTSASENKLISDPVVVDIAMKCEKSPAQILLRWAVQQDIGVLPKSTNPAHIVENMDIFSFSLSTEQLQALSNLDQQMHYCWDPVHIA
ncbi:glyoxal reductase [Aplysia californica]|uniref:Glyoxal reductase n=1 Tax=Aplysia californica TaxID=6500 RepID=A0ABM0JBP5_APLCA|nr:glyoxal reductase [Aplysia californica]